MKRATVFVFLSKSMDCSENNRLQVVVRPVILLCCRKAGGYQVHYGKWAGREHGSGPESIGGVMRWLGARLPWSSLCPSFTGGLVKKIKGGANAQDGERGIDGEKKKRKKERVGGTGTEKTTTKGEAMEGTRQKRTVSVVWMKEKPREKERGRELQRKTEFSRDDRGL